MIWVCKRLDLFAGHTDQVEDLELVRQSGRFGVQLALFRLARIGRSMRFFLDFGRKVFKVGPKHFHLADQLVGRSLHQLHHRRLTLMGIPVAWYPRGNKTFLPRKRSKPAANSTLLMVNA